MTVDARELPVAADRETSSWTFGEPRTLAMKWILGITGFFGVIYFLVEAAWTYHIMQACLSQIEHATRAV